jgi:hypothetical protein
MPGRSLSLPTGAQSLQVVTLDLSNPDYDPAVSGTSKRINSTYSFSYVTSFNLRTLSTNGASPGADITGLLYVPDLDKGSNCINASAPYVPTNVTRRTNLPDEDYDLIAIAPWLSPECVQEYFEAARDAPARGFLFFLPGDNTTNTPPEVNDAVWGLGDGGSWKRQNEFPVIAIPGVSAQILLAASAQYSKNMTDVPYGHILTEYYDSRDYVRLYVDIDTAGSSTSLPSLWVFLLVVLGILLAVIGLTSLAMHWLQRTRRRNLRRRVADGEVDLEALGIKRLTVPQELLDRMPLYTYGSGAPATRSITKDEGTETAESQKLGSAESSRPGSPLSTARPIPVRATSFNPNPLQQPTCAICLDDFVPASEREEGTTVRELPCHHIFHPECVDTFLRDNSSLCPLCKKTALPKGYCPRVVTNAMVRRERMMRRIRERVTIEAEDDESLDGNTDSSMARLQSRLGGRFLRTRDFSAFSGFSRLRSARGRRISSAPLPTEQAMTEIPQPPPAMLRSHSSPVRRQSRIQPPPNLNTQSRREWARQRAVAMLGRRPAPTDLEEEERRTTPGWRKAMRGVFPGLGR